MATVIDEDVLPEMEWRRITLNEEIGRGTFGAVYAGRVVPYGSVAVKKLNNDNGNMRPVDELRKEAQVMGRVRHENVIKLIAVSWTPQGNLALILPRMDASLRKMLDRRDSRLSAELRESAALQAAQGLQALHASGILHRDVKSENALVDLLSSGGIRLCWADFGIAHSASGTLRTCVDSQMGTLGYIAPELFEMDSEGKVGFSEQSDAFAYGVVLAELLSGKKAFDRSQPNYFLTFVMKQANWGPAAIDADVFSQSPRVVQSLSHVAKVCVAENRDDRPTFTQVVEMLCDIERSAAGVQVVIGQPEEPRECKVCMSAPVQTLLYPCHHACLCVTCANRAVRDKCPLCRSRVSHFQTFEPGATAIGATFLAREQTATSSSQPSTTRNRDPVDDMESGSGSVGSVSDVLHALAFLELLQEYLKTERDSASQRTPTTGPPTTAYMRVTETISQADRAGVLQDALGSALRGDTRQEQRPARIGGSAAAPTTPAQPRREADASVVELKVLIAQAGLSYEDCIEKHELLTRAEQAKKLLRERQAATRNIPEQQRRDTTQTTQSFSSTGTSGERPSATSERYDRPSEDEKRRIRFWVLFFGAAVLVTGLIWFILWVVYAYDCPSGYSQWRIGVCDEECRYDSSKLRNDFCCKRSEGYCFVEWPLSYNRQNVDYSSKCESGYSQRWNNICRDGCECPTPDIANPRSLHCNLCCKFDGEWCRNPKPTG